MNDARETSMQWTQQIGRPRAASARALCDALRFLVVVHRLGHDGAAERPLLRGEERARWLDHLVRRPASLAYLLMHLRSRGELRAETADAAQTVRWVLAQAPRRDRPSRHRAARAWRVEVDPRRLHRFEPEIAPLRDDALAHLVTRRLLAVDVEGGELVYRLTAGGEDLLDDAVYPRHAEAGRHRRLCGVIEEAALGTAISDPRRTMDEVDRHLEALRDEIGVPPERDLARELFQVTFRERL